MRPPRILSLACIVLAAAVAARCEDIQVVWSGDYHDPISGYRAAGRYFLNAKQAGELYGGQVYWYPISGRVRMSFRGRLLQFLVDSDKAVTEDRSFSLDAPVMLRASQAYVPLSFFLGPEFAAFSGMESQFNERTKLLSVDRRSSVGPVHWFSYQDYTRVALEVNKGMRFEASARGVKGVDITVPLGLITGYESMQVGDGLVEDFALRQEAKVARLTVRFAQAGLRWRVRELAEPRRLAVDIARADYDDMDAIPSQPQELPVLSGKGERLPSEDRGSLDPALSTAAVPARAPIAAAEASTAAIKAPARRRIIIDAGHGGKDSGAVGRRGTLEKDINLAAAKELGKLLQEERVFEVLLTRDDDTFIPLADRSRMANEAPADLFVSLHCNATRNQRESGFEVYFLSEKASDPEAEKLAEFENSVLAFEGKSVQDEHAALILRAMTKTENINAASELAALVGLALERRVDLDDRGVKQAAFYVLRGTDAPAVLVEMAFLSNRKDEAKLESRRYRHRLVDGIYAGLVEYAKRQGWLKKAAGQGRRP